MSPNDVTHKWKYIFFPLYNIIRENNLVILNAKRVKKERNEALANGRNEARIIEKKRRLSKRVKFTLNSLSHYKFREHLLEKGKEYGSQIIVVGEEYTSKTCTNCGVKSDEYNKSKRMQKLQM